MRRASCPCSSDDRSRSRSNRRRPSPLAIMLIVTLLVGTLVTLAAVGIGFLGKSLTPKKRGRDNR